MIRRATEKTHRKGRDGGKAKAKAKQTVNGTTKQEDKNKA